MDPIFLVKRRRFLTREEEAEILMKKASGKFTDKELAQQYGVCRETIVRVKKRWSPTVQAAQVYARSADSPLYCRVWRGVKRLA